MNYIGYDVTTNKTSPAGNKPSKMQWEYNNNNDNELYISLMFDSSSTEPY